MEKARSLVREGMLQVGPGIKKALYTENAMMQEVSQYYFDEKVKMVLCVMSSQEGFVYPRDLLQLVFGNYHLGPIYFFK